MALKVGELVALFTGDAKEYFRTSAKVRADAKELDGMEPTIRPKIAETQASRAARAAGKTIGNSVKAGFATAGVGAALAGSMAVAAAAVPAAVGLAGAFGVVAAAGKEVADTMSAYNAAQEAATQGAQAAAEAQAEFARQFSELTAEGQALTAQLIQMGPAMDRLGDVAQSSVLPGFTQLLQTSEELFPTIEHGLEAVGGAMSDTAAQAARLAGSEAFQDDLWSAFDNGADITRALGGMVVDLTGDFVDFAGKAQPATAGMVDMIGQLSDGMSSFLSNAAPGMESYGSILRSVGGILDSTLGTAGELMAMLANEGAPTIERLEQAWSQLLGVVEQFASSGMGPLMSGFGTLLDVLSGLLAVLEPIAPLLGTITGAVLPFVAALKLVDTVTFGGVKKKMRGLGEEIDLVEGKRKKFATGAKGMIGAVLNPWGLALAGVGTILMQIAGNEQAAAQAAAAHEQAVTSLTDAILADGGAMGEHTRKVVESALASDKARQKAHQLGVSYQLVTEAAMGNQTAVNKLNEVMNGNIDKLAAQADGNESLFAQMRATTKAAREKGGAARELVDITRQAIENDAQLTDEQKKQMLAMLDLNVAIGKNSRASEEAKRVAQELAAAENNVTVETLKHWSALLKLNAELLKSVNTNIGARAAALQLEQANKRAAEALNKHGKESQEYRSAAIAQERAIMGVLTAVRDKTYQDKKALPPQKRNIAAARAMQAEAIRLAQTYEGPLPRALAEYIAGMSRSEAAAHGAKFAINDAGEAVYRLPNGKTINIGANTSPFWAAINSIPQVVKNVGITVSGWGNMFRAEGGPVEKGRGYIVGEEGPEWFEPKRDGMIHTAPATAAMFAGSAPQPMAASMGTSAPAAAPAPAGSSGRAPSAAVAPGPVSVSDLRRAMDGLTFVLDDDAGRVMARVVNRVNKSNARR